MSRSRNKDLVRDHYTCGQKAYKEGRFEDAWKNFDKAISFGGKTLLLLDSKAAAMTKLPEWRRHAYELTKDMIQKYPNDWQGPYRQAKVLQSLDVLDKALIAASAAVKLSPKQSENEKVFRSIQSLRADIIMAKDAADRKRARNDENERVRQAAARRAAIKAKINYTHLLSQDVLVTICEMGMRDQPGFVLRMAAVCRTWRGVLLSQGSLWNRLVLGKRKAVEKANVYMERTNGRVRDITFAKGFDMTKADEVAIALKPCLKELQRLDFQLPPASIAQHWQGALENIVYLRLRRPPEPDRNIDLLYGLLSPLCTSLRELDSDGGAICHLFDAHTYEAPYDPDDEVELPFWTRHPKANLGGIKVVRMAATRMYSEWTDVSELLCHFSSAEYITLEATGHTRYPSLDRTSPWLQWRQHCYVEHTLPNLRSFAQTHQLSDFKFDGITVPNLQHLDLWNSSCLGGVTILPVILAPGLRVALPNLLSLDIGRCPVDQNGLLDVLAQLPSLQFLNVSYCSLDNTFIEALERTGENKDLLPRLTALSIAGTEEITAGPLRRMVYSRMPRRTRLSTEQPTPSGPKRGSSFRPSAPKSSPFGPTKPADKSKRGNPSLTQRSIPVVQSVPSPPIANPVEPSETPATLEAELPSLSWLCIDNCDRIDPEISDHLRSKVRFLSHNFGAVQNEQRIRGKGKWAWDADYTEVCETGAGGCGMRKQPGTKDGWYVHHTCGPKEVLQSAPSWTQSSIQFLGSSQQTAL